MAITVVGSVAYDSIETPAGRRERCLAAQQPTFRCLPVSLPMCASSLLWAKTSAPSSKLSLMPQH